MSTPGRSKRKRKPASTRPSTRAYTADIAAALVSDPVEDDLPRYQALIDAAAAHDDSWFQRCFPAFSRFRRLREERAPIDVDIGYAHAADLSEEDAECIFDLTKTNMQTLYDACETPGWSWDDGKKREELSDPEARFLLAVPRPSSPPSSASSTSSPLPIGFLHLRYLMENDLPVLYVYELQLRASHQRCGLGSFLMQSALLMCAACQLSRTMLTVFRYNTAAVQLYSHRLHFTPDETSPDNSDEADYHILSRLNPRFIP